MVHARGFVRSLLVAVCVGGCSYGPTRITPPKIVPERAATQAIELYDTDKDGSLNAAEVAKCPGMLAAIKSYDKDGNGLVSREEIAARIKELRSHGVGLTRVNCEVTLNAHGL